MQARPPYVIPPAPQPPRSAVPFRYTPTWRHNNAVWVYVGALDSAKTQVNHLNPKPKGDPERVLPTAWWWDSMSQTDSTGFYLKNGSPGFQGLAASAVSSRDDLTVGRAAARAAALEKLNEDVRSSANVAIDLLQANRTARIHKDVNIAIRAFAQVEERIDDRLKRVPKKDRPELLRLLRRFGPAGRKIRIVDRTLRAGFRDISKIWLTWIYGLKPTLQSIHDSVTFTQEHYANHGFCYRGRRTIKDYRTTAAAWPTVYDNATIHAISSRRCEFNVVLAIPDLLETQVARLAQLSPSVLMWELLPFSFVYDWFQNIAGYLSDTETACTYARYFKRGYQTDSWRDDVFTQHTGDTVFRQVYGQAAHRIGTAQITWKGMQRFVLTSYPIPVWPKFQPRLGAQRLFTAATLVGAFLDRKKLRVATGLYT